MGGQRSPKIPIWVVVRVDGLIDRHDPQTLRNRITVVEAFPTVDEAEAEVTRLNEVNADKGCVYFWAPTRFFPEGRHVERGY